MLKGAFVCFSEFLAKRLQFAFKSDTQLAHTHQDQWTRLLATEYFDVKARAIPDRNTEAYKQVGCAPVQAIIEREDGNELGDNGIGYAR